MTVTKRKASSRENENNSNDTAGVKYTCDGCSADISHTVKIRCAHQQTQTNNTIAGQNQVTSNLVCENFDLCAQCFCEGKEVGRHKAWHDYRVVEQYSTPIFTEDWGADEELLLIEACQTYGLGNWADIADHVGNGRTKEEVAKHYEDVFIYSDDYPLPLMDVRIDIDQDEFQARKKQRLEEVQARPFQPPPPKPLASGPSNHEIAGFMPGRLDFETEWENDAENSIKDLSFGRVYRFGGDSQPERAPDPVQDAVGLDDATTTVEGINSASECQSTIEAGSSTEVKQKRGLGTGAGKVTQRKDETVNPMEDIVETVGDESNLEAAVLPPMESKMHSSSEEPIQPTPSGPPAKPKGKEKETKKVEEDNETEEEAAPPIHDEDDDALELKLTILDIYNERYDKRLEAKAVVFDRNLLEIKKIQAAEKKMPKEVRDLVVRIKPFARLQTALDHEKFQEGLIYEMTLRKRIAELQEYRRIGITTLAEAERFEKERQSRIPSKGREFNGLERANGRNKNRVSGSGPFYDELVSGSREGTPGFAGKTIKRLTPLPLSLATSASQQLLHCSELALCSRLRVLPKPFLFLKELLFREYVRFAAMGRTLKRSDVSNLLPLAPTIDEDALELELECVPNNEGDLSIDGIGIIKAEEMQQQQQHVVMESGKPKAKWTKLEAMWDFYFGADDEEGEEPDEPCGVNVPLAAVSGHP
ncbi:transcriptional adapter 2-alpha [Melampsora americana]|nr:transcriptional adapter 2-alpha [Melampsora americana]